MEITNVLTWTLYGVMAVVSVQDLRRRIILDKVLLATAPLAFAAHVLMADSILGGAIHSLAGGSLGFLAFLLLAVVLRGHLGGGDVKLAAVLGLWLGLQLIPIALALAFLLAGLSILLPLKGRLLPFGPFLCAGAILAYLGSDVLLPLSPWG